MCEPGQKASFPDPVTVGVIIRHLPIRLNEESENSLGRIMHACAHVYTCVHVYVQRTLRILGTVGKGGGGKIAGTVSARETETRGLKSNLTYFHSYPELVGKSSGELMWDNQLSRINKRTNKCPGS